MMSVSSVSTFPLSDINQPNIPILPTWKGVKLDDLPFYSAFNSLSPSLPIWMTALAYNNLVSQGGRKDFHGKAYMSSLSLMRGKVNYNYEGYIEGTYFSRSCSSLKRAFPQVCHLF